jgi:urease accessory protein
MLAGDQTTLKVHIDREARCFLSTQSATKIYRNPTRLPCSHELHVTLESGALLVLAPDAVQCFTDSIYHQRQHFDLAATSNLILIDWLSGGRTACGERWSFVSYSSSNVIRREGRVVLLDPLRLDSSHAALAHQFRSGRYNCFATVVVLGRHLEPQTQQILKTINEAPVTRQSDLVFSASPLAEGVLVRLAGVRIEEVGHAIHQSLRFVKDLIQDDFWSRKW